MLRKMDDRQTAKLAAKLPSWASCKTLNIPSSLALEQCSSEATAKHKASVIAAASATRQKASIVEMASGDANTSILKIADLTGGLGVDSWAFSKEFGEVLHNEMNASLSEAVRSNFDALGVGNVRFCCEEISPDSLADGRIGAILGEFSPDVIFLDPSRRSKTGSKVFLPEDCSPDIISLMPRLIELSPLVAVKLSPVMDISLLAKKLPSLRDIHVVGAFGECKELLCIIGRESSEEYLIITEELDSNGDVNSIYARIESRNSSCSNDRRTENGSSSCSNDRRTENGEIGDNTRVEFAMAEDLVTGNNLFVPSPIALKSSCHTSVAAASGLRKLDRSTQIYIGRGEPASAFFKGYSILEVHPLSNSSIKDIAARYPSSDVTARNIPLSSDQLREKLYGKARPRSGVRHHIFGVSTAAFGRMLIVAKPII